MTWRRVPRRPAWGLMYAIGALSTAALVLIETAVPRGAIRSVLQIAVIVGCYTLVRVWIAANRGAMEFARWNATRRQSLLLDPAADDHLVRGDGWAHPTPATRDESSERNGRRRAGRAA